MKTVLLFLALGITAITNAQKQAVYYVTSVCGSASKAGHKLSVGDTIMEYDNVIKFGKESSITLFNASSGSIHLSDQQENTGSHFWDDLCELFKLKSSRVSLSSRGDCDGSTLDDCLKTDSAINQKLLLIDSLMLPMPLVENSNGTKSNYFLQWKCNGKTINKFIGCCNGHLCIKSSDLIDDSVNYNESYGNIILGVEKQSPQGKTYEKIGAFQIYCTTSAFINQYYSGLQQIMKSSSSKDIFTRFYSELYIFYGRPDACFLKTLVHYN